GPPRRNAMTARAIADCGLAIAELPEATETSCTRPASPRDESPRASAASESRVACHPHSPEPPPPGRPANPRSAIRDPQLLRRLHPRPTPATAARLRESRIPSPAA